MSQTSAPQTTPKRNNKRSPPANSVTTPPKKTRVVGFNFDISTVLEHQYYLPNIVDMKWASIIVGGSQKQVVDSSGKPLLFLLFGAVKSPRMTIYGDLNDKYHTDLINPSVRSMSFRLRSIPGYEEDFVKSTTKIHAIENSISEAFLLQASNANRALKGSSEIELKRKIAAKAISLESYVPEDLEGSEHWKKAKQQGFCANPLPLGLYNVSGELVSFNNYSKVLTDNTSVLISARMQSTNFQGNPFIQVVPFKIQVIDIQGVTDESLTDIF
ncbi:hypothetical protein BC833DRAFT_626760 [Globomyces pollinis-pini]|nr:hypothetical protein BC833DRAFT_626760 [Globomyces pollinis-pini]KAJ2989193.1 hypothetical protein HDV02_005128 [Globomyces sp. JEL0801]